MLFLFVVALPLEASSLRFVLRNHLVDDWIVEFGRTTLKKRDKIERTFRKVQNRENEEEVGEREERGWKNAPFRARGGFALLQALKGPRRGKKEKKKKKRKNQKSKTDNNENWKRKGQYRINPYGPFLILFALASLGKGRINTRPEIVAGGIGAIRH